MDFKALKEAVPTLAQGLSNTLIQGIKAFEDGRASFAEHDLSARGTIQMDGGTRFTIVMAIIDVEELN